MLIIPAIDIREGRVVRLLQGRYEKETVYSDEPVEIAKKWVACGAKRLHIVDLDGALSGKLKNLNVIEEIIRQTGVSVELGGGVRTKRAVERVLNKGIEFVILGTKACQDRHLLDEVAAAFGEKIIVSIDAREGLVATEGWTKLSQTTASDLARQVESAGVKTIVYTDISRDGMLEGPDLEGIKDILDTTGLSVIASGGVSCLDDITQLDRMGVMGIIIGKALYEGRIDPKGLWKNI